MYFLQSIVFTGAERKGLISAIARKLKATHKMTSRELERILCMCRSVEEIHIDEILKGSPNRDITNHIIEKLMKLKILERPIDKEIEIAFKDAEDDVFDEIELSDGIEEPQESTEKKEHDFATKLDQLFQDLVNVIKKEWEKIGEPKRFYLIGLDNNVYGKTICEGIVGALSSSKFTFFKDIRILILLILDNEKIKWEIDYFSDIIEGQHCWPNRYTINHKFIDEEFRELENMKKQNLVIDISHVL